MAELPKPRYLDFDRGTLVFEYKEQEKAYAMHDTLASQGVKVDIWHAYKATPAVYCVAVPLQVEEV